MITLGNEVIAKLDELIRYGKSHEARAFIKKIKIRNSNLALLPKLCHILTRSGMAKKTILILRPYVQPEILSHKKATEEIKAEYALALTQVGATPEAIELFKKINYTSAPKGLLYHAIALFTQWDYAAATPLLYKYLQTPRLSDYEILVGKVNLAAAYIDQQKYSEAEKLLENLLSVTKKNDFKLLYGNCLELSVQLATNKKDYISAKKSLALANESLENGPQKYQLMVAKWQAITDFGASPKSKTNIKALANVKQKAIKMGHWETVRDFDFYQDYFTQDSALYLKVYFGTPQAAYRLRLKRLYKSNIELPENYSWNPTGEQRQKDHVIDAQMGKDLRSGATLKFDSNSYRLFLILASDFYLPYRVESLF